MVITTLYHEYPVVIPALILEYSEVISTLLPEYSIVITTLILEYSAPLFQLTIHFDLNYKPVKFKASKRMWARDVRHEGAITLVSATLHFEWNE